MRFVPGVLPVIKHIFHKTTVKIFTTTSSNPTRGWTQPMSVSGVTPMYVFVSTGTQYQRHHYHFIITSSFKKLGAWPTFKGRGCDPVSPPQSRTAYEYHTHTHCRLPEFRQFSLCWNYSFLHQHKQIQLRKWNKKLSCRREAAWRLVCHWIFR